MIASFEGHVDIVRMIIEANAQVNTQEEVRMLFLLTHNTLHNTSLFTVVIYGCTL